MTTSFDTPQMQLDWSKLILKSKMSKLNLNLWIKL